MASVEVTISKVSQLDLSELLPLMRAYCDFYEVEPRDCLLYTSDAADE